MRDKLFIVEISDDDVRAIAQGLHILIENQHVAEPAVEALDSLSQQTYNVYKNPSQHSVYENRITAPTGAIPIPRVCYVPIR